MQNGVELHPSCDDGRPDGCGDGSLVAVAAAALTVYDMCKARSIRGWKSRHCSRQQDGREERDFHRKGAPSKGRDECGRRKSVSCCWRRQSAGTRTHRGKAWNRSARCETSAGRADALLKVIDNPPDVSSATTNAGAGRTATFRKAAPARDATKHIPFLFMASRPGHRGAAEALGGRRRRIFIPKPFL